MSRSSSNPKYTSQLVGLVVLMLSSSRESQQCTPVMKISIKRMITINNNSNSLFNKLKETKLAFSFEALNIENWNQAYEAINFMFNHVTFKSRLAKNTKETRLFCCDMA